MYWESSPTVTQCGQRPKHKVGNLDTRVLHEAALRFMGSASSSDFNHVDRGFTLTYNFEG